MYMHSMEKAPKMRLVGVLLEKCAPARVPPSCLVSVGQYWGVRCGAGTARSTGSPRIGSRRMTKWRR